jgi:hypothetical protein
MHTSLQRRVIIRTTLSERDHHISCTARRSITQTALFEESFLQIALLEARIAKALKR